MTQKEKAVKKVLIVCSKGSLVDVYPSLVMANGALAEGMQAELFFTFFGLDAVTKGKTEKLKVNTVGNPAMGIPTVVGAIPGMSAMASSMMKKKMEKIDIPSVSEYFDMIVAGGGKLYGCKLAMDMFGLKRKDLIDDIEDVLTVGQFYDRAEKDTQIIFT